MVPESFDKGQVISPHTLHCYTDGSKNSQGHTGLGVAIFRPDSPQIPPHLHNRYLGMEATVFQAEVSAILESCYLIYCYLKQHQSIPRRVIIYTDNQAAILALQNTYTTSRLVRQCISSLNTLGLTTHILIRYVKAHSGYVGNELADSQAKYATTQPLPYNKPLVALSKASFKQHINEAIRNEWAKRWAESPVKQTKCWFPTLSPAKSSLLIQQPRAVFSRAVRFLTGHCFLRRQRTLVDQSAPSDLCRLCNREKERAIHILTECPCLQPLRLQTMGSAFLSPTVPSWQPRRLLAFLASPRVADLELD